MKRISAPISPECGIEIPPPQFATCDEQTCVLLTIKVQTLSEEMSKCQDQVAVPGLLRPAILANG
jgi:hypothetical protein